MKALIQNVLEDNRQVHIEVERNDVISMDCTMSILLLPMMRKFKEQEANALHQRRINPAHVLANADDEGMAKWYATIDEIIWAMEVTASGECFDWFEDKMHLHTRREKAFKSFGENFCNFWI